MTFLLNIFKECLLHNKNTKKLLKLSKENCNFKLKNIEIKTKDFVKIKALIYEPEFIDQGTQFFVFLHCNSANRTYFHNLFVECGVLDKNVCVIIPDYREFGDSEGVFTKDSVVYDIDACINYFNNFYNLESINLIGYSLGCAVGLEYMKKYMPKNISKIILISPFTSVLNVAKKNIFFKIACLFSNLKNEIIELYNFDLLDCIGYVSCPVLCVIGLKDCVSDIENINMFKRENVKVLRTEYDHGSMLYCHSTWHKMLNFLK